jgi:hypothetical protein
MILCSTIFVVNVSAKSSADELVNEFVESVSELVDTWTNPKIIKGDFLYGIDDKKVGYMYRVFEDNEQRGYVLFLDSVGIAEATWEGTDSAVNIQGKVYYATPGLFMSKSEFAEYQENQIDYILLSENMLGSTVYHVTNGTTGAMDTISNFSFSYSNVPNLASNVLSIGYTYSIRKTVQNVPDYNWYEGCAPTSGGMLVAYYDNEIWDTLSDYDGTNDYPLSYEWVDRWLLSDYARNYDEVDDLISELASSTYFNTNSSGGTTIAQMNVGLEDYFADNGLSTYAVYLGDFDTNWSDYQSIISSGNVTLISILGHPVYGNHAVLGMGYLLAAPSTSGAIVHDTWPTEEGYPKEIFISYDLLTYYSFIYND